MTYTITYENKYGFCYEVDVTGAGAYNAMLKELAAKDCKVVTVKVR